MAMHAGALKTPRPAPSGSGPSGQIWRRWRPAGLRTLLRGDGGMSTAEYAIGTLAAAAFASVLYVVVTSDAVTDMLTSLVQRALESTV